MKHPNFQQQIFSIIDREEFNVLALDLFRYQAVHNPIYHEFLRLLKVNHHQVQTISEIPFLPIEAFKNHKITTGEFTPEAVFTSSGTTSSTTSSHPVRSLAIYEQSFSRGFQHFYGAPEDYCLLALLPSYLERSGSSLIYMAQKLMEQSGHPQNGFYLNQLADLSAVLKSLSNAGQPTILLGVSYALLDLAEQFPQPLHQNIRIMETGGMKGRRIEITREKLHHQLCEAFQLKEIHSEYGMTELLSQAYSRGSGKFYCPPWMQVITREQDDPFSLCTEKTGGLNVIDLANIDSCAFIATSDLGRVHSDGSFEVLGRFDFSDVRGCNLMVQ